MTTITVLPVGYRPLSEYFAFPDKFSSSTSPGSNRRSLTRATSCRSRSSCIATGQRAPPSFGTDAECQQLRLAATPGNQLLQHAGDPIRISHHKTSYPVIRGRRASNSAYEVISIDTVTCAQKS